MCLCVCAVSISILAWSAYTSPRLPLFASALCNEEAGRPPSDTRRAEVPPSHTEPDRRIAGAGYRSEGAWVLLLVVSSISSQLLRLLLVPPNSSSSFWLLATPAGSSFQDREGLVRLMLNKVIAPEQFPQVVKEQVSPYCSRHQMNLDHALVHYMKVRRR